MKRTSISSGSKPLKRTPLKQTSDLGGGGTGLKRTGGLRPRSKKTQDLYRTERIPLVIRILKERPVCERCQRNESCDVHEVLTRGRSGGVRGSAWLDPDNLAALCRPCHIWVTEHPIEAAEEGWVRTSDRT